MLPIRTDTVTVVSDHVLSDSYISVDPGSDEIAAMAGKF
jgi:hypothetical protein